jgi:predicted nucleic acid-binding protein
VTLEHLPVLERFVKLNAMGWHTYLDMVTAAARDETVEARDAYMARNAKRYGIDLAHPLA